MALAEDANQEMSSQFELAENLRKLEKATVARHLGGYDLPTHQSKASWLEWLQGVIVWIIIIIYIIYIYTIELFLDYQILESNSRKHSHF